MTQTLIRYQGGAAHQSPLEDDYHSGHNKKNIRKHYLLQFILRGEPSGHALDEPGGAPGGGRTRKDTV